MTRGQKQRLFLVILFALALAVLARQVVHRGLGGSDEVRTENERPAPSWVDGAEDRLGLDLEKGLRSQALRAARAFLAEGRPIVLEGDRGPGGEPLRVLASLSRAGQPALVAQGEGETLTAALTAALEDLKRRAEPQAIATGQLKIDLLAAASPEGRLGPRGETGIARSLEGIELPRQGLVLLPEELLSRLLLNSDGRLHEGRLSRYLAEGARSRRQLEGFEVPGEPFRKLSFDSFMEGPDGLPIRLFRGNDLSPSLAPSALLAAAVAGGDYLLRHLKADGTFDYSYEPKRDSLEKGYNLLRHAGTCYALLELYRETRDERYREGARRGLEALLLHARPPKPEDAAAGFSAIVSPGEEAKLGGAALALLAMVEYQRVTGDDRFLEQGRLFSRFLVFMQDEDGHFRSKYFYGPPDPEPFESIYYPGEAILALQRFYRLDPDPRWLTTSQRGADWLIQVRDQGKPTARLPHDHWLLMGLNELHEQTGQPHYLAHAVKIGEAILGAQRRQAPWPDWVGTFYDPPRSTPTATRAEALVAMHHLAARNDLDTRPYREALMLMAAFQRRCQLTPENALYLPRPDRALGGFRRSLTNWEVRIDYVQHNVSALLGLRSLIQGAD